MLPSLQLGGAERKAVLSAVALNDAEGGSVALVVLDATAPSELLGDMLRRASVETVLAPIFSPRLRRVRRVLWLRRLLVHRDIQVAQGFLHANDYVLLAATGLPVRVFLGIRGIEQLGRSRRLCFTVVGPRKRAQVIANSAPALTAFRNQTWRRLSGAVVPNILDATSAKRVDGQERERSRQALGVHTHFVIVSVANMHTPVKGHVSLLRSFAAVGHDLNARLILVGDGKLRPRLEAEATRLGIAHQVTFVGARPDPRVYLAAADVFVSASFSESLSNSIIEALASGLPVVATNVGGTPTLVHDGVNGFLVPAGDEEALALALTRDFRRLRAPGLLPGTVLSPEDAADTYLGVYHAQADVGKRLDRRR